MLTLGRVRVKIGVRVFNDKWAVRMMVRVRAGVRDGMIVGVTVGVRIGVGIGVRVCIRDGVEVSIRAGARCFVIEGVGVRDRVRVRGIEKELDMGSVLFLTYDISRRDGEQMLIIITWSGSWIRIWKGIWT